MFLDIQQLVPLDDVRRNPSEGELFPPTATNVTLLEQVANPLVVSYRLLKVFPTVSLIPVVTLIL